LRSNYSNNDCFIGKKVIQNTRTINIVIGKLYNLHEIMKERVFTN